MKLVKHILSLKGQDVWTTTLDTSVLDAIKLMSEKRVGALPVVVAGKLVGIVSEQDCTRRVILQDKPARETPVKEVMTAPVIYVTPEERIETCMALMTERRVRHLPVLDEGEMVGIISIGDLIKTIIADQEQWIQELESHVLQTTSIV